MTKSHVQTAVGIFILVSHFGALALVAYFMVVHRFLPDEGWAAIAIIGPMVGAYTTIIVKYAVSHPDRSAHNVPKKLNFLFVVTSFLIPLFFVGSLFGLVILWAYFRNVFDQSNFHYHHWELLVAFNELIFGVYLGQILSGLFEE